MPTATDLVTDLPADFEVFGQAVDTSLSDLKGGTTNQVLAKNSNTDMDFKWVTDATGMTNPMTTTGDTIYSSSGSTPARLGIGTSGQVMTVSGAGIPSWTTPAATTPTYVGVSVYKSAAQSISNLTFTAVTFNTEDFDTDAFHDNSTNTSRFTIPSGKAGKYLLTGNVNYLAGNVTGVRGAAIYKNGSAYNYQAQQPAVSPSPYGTNVKVSFVLDLAVADYIEIFAFQGDGGSLDVANTQPNTNVQMTYLGA